jgi:autotransporter-associated beta strand protein
MLPQWLNGTTNQGEGIANVLTWTAPAAGTYTFSGSFVIGGTDPSASGASFAIVDSLGNIALPRAVGNQTSTHVFDFTQELSAGDVLQFQVGSGFAPAAPVGLNVDVVLEDAGGANNKVSVAKTGAGKWVLGGANIYTGDTIVSEGVLELGSGGSLRFVVGDSGVNNQLKGAGTLNLNGQLAFDLSGASTNTNSTWAVVSNSLSTTYGTNFLVTGFNGSGGNWTNTTNGVDYVFAQSTGVLSVQATGGVTPYNAWVTYWQGIDPGFTNTAPGGDPDGDSFSNKLEFAFGGDPTIGTAALLSALRSGPNVVFNYIALTNTNAATYAVQNTTNLATGPWTNASVTLSNATNQSGILIPADYVRKEFTVPAAGKDFYRVRATTLP